MTKLRVLHVTPYFAPAFVYGGPPRSILGLCSALVKLGVHVDVATTTANGTGQPLPAATREAVTVDGVPVRYFPWTEPRWLWHGAGMHRALADDIASYDVVHIHGLWHLPAWQAARLARRLGVPYVVSPRGMLQPEALAIGRARKTMAFELIERRNLGRAACLHATSARERDTLEARRLGPPVVLAPNGVAVDQMVSTDPAETLREFGLPPDGLYVLFLGRIHPIKRLDLLAAAVRRMRVPGVRVVVAGPDEDGHRAALAPQFAEAGVGVTWTGPVDARRKADLLAAARALVLCSDSESFGLAAVEAMAAGTPVVATTTCPWEEIEREGAGRWVPQDAGAIAAALDAVVGDPAAARAMGARGRALAARRYSWPAAARIVADRYGQLAAGRGRVARAG